jgi:hypothetical protein
MPVGSIRSLMPAAWPPEADGEGRVLTTLIGVMDHCRRATPTNDHVQGVEHQLRSAVRRYGQPDHPATPGIEHDREEEEPAHVAM